LRQIIRCVRSRALVDEALTGLSRDGQPSILPERLLRALLLQAFYSIRSEQLRME
jgi:transposase